MLASVLSGYCTALLAPLIQSRWPRAAAFCFAGLPLILMLYLASFSGGTSAGGITTTTPWVPSLGMSLTFTLDGLSLLFALIVTGVGALVLFYASGYLEEDRELGHFYAYLLAFMASMLGLVLAGNLLLIYLFWELTSITSYLLIGYHHEEEKSRDAALQALLVTGAGGLSMLAGFLIIGIAAGTFEIPQLMQSGEQVRSHPLYLPALLLILAGAFTKSAQVPFHFWLPSAMVAPTPVSAYLHSAAMVKAGIYLLARLSPVLGGTEAWYCILTATGGITMLTGAVLAVVQTDLKKILAYSTVSALGMLTLLLGFGTAPAVKAAAVYLLVHALYKGSLFLTAGAVDHATGTRDVLKLGGLGRAMPIVAVAAALAALSMAGLPPLFGFVGKELVYEAKLHAPHAPWLFAGAGIMANILMVAQAGMVSVGPFFGAKRETPLEPHHAAFSIWLGPVLLGGLGLLLGLFPGLLDRPLMAPLVSTVLAEPTAVELKLWHGFNLVLLLSVFTVLAGVGVYAARSLLYRVAGRCGMLASWGPSRWYDLILAGMLRSARFQTRILQSGYLRYYLMTVLGAAFLLIFYALAGKSGFRGWGRMPEAYFHEWVIAVMILVAALFAATARSRLASVAALGAVGYGVALVYIAFGAPDLAMTQFCVETLSIILFVLVLYRLPRFTTLSGTRARSRDVLFSLANGVIMTAVVLTAVSEPVQYRISHFFARNASVQAHGRNVVNVILVDFRALDTLGEITVLTVASLGVYTLLRGLADKEDK